MSDMFEQFWKRCPDRGPKASKGSKKKARELFEKHVEKDKTVTFADIIRAVEKWRSMESHKSGEDRSTVPMVQTWLQQERWEELLEQPEPVLKPVEKPKRFVGMDMAMRSDMGQYALSEGCGTDFWLQIERRNRDSREYGDPFKFMNDAGGQATRYIKDQIAAVQRIKNMAEDMSQMPAEELNKFRKIYKSMLKKERAFAKRYC